MRLRGGLEANRPTECVKRGFEAAERDRVASSAVARAVAVFAAKRCPHATRSRAFPPCSRVIAARANNGRHGVPLFRASVSTAAVAQLVVR